MIDRNRLVNDFLEFVKIPSPSKKEAQFAKHVKNILDQLELETFFDNAGEKIGGDCGNLIARFKGNQSNVAPLLFCMHFDTVEPCQGVNPQIKNGVITSDGRTILGADNKAAIAEVIETLRVIKENNLSTGDIEILITVAEEIGLLGVKQFDPTLIKARRGYVLDTGGVDRVVIKAPAAKKLLFKIYGKEAHAGVAPEEGINAIKVAGVALAKMRLGRIDKETTANIGVIEGGLARNIVPNLVILKGEARSHSFAKLNSQIAHMKKCFTKAVKFFKTKVNNKQFQAKVEMEIEDDYPRMVISKNSPSIKLILRAGKSLNRIQTCLAAGGGSDANILNQMGLDIPIISTGAEKVHTRDECIKIDNMVKTTELLLAIISENVKTCTR